MFNKPMKEKTIIEKEPTPEKKEFGKNVEIHAIFVRHGEKAVSTTTSETALTEKGEKVARDFGSELDERKAIKSYASDTSRTKETADLIVETSPTAKKMKQKVKQELGFVFDPNGKLYKDLMELKSKILGKNFNELPEKEQNEKIHDCERQQINYYLSFGEKRPDPGTYSPVETAAMVARRLDKYMRMPEKLQSNSNIDLINTSHDVTLSAFLSEIIIQEKDGKRVRGFDDVEEIGGSLNYNEGFEIEIKTDNEGDESVKMTFRGREYDIDLARINELVTIAKSLEKEI